MRGEETGWTAMRRYLAAVSTARAQYLGVPPPRIFEYSAVEGWAAASPAQQVLGEGHSRSEGYLQRRVCMSSRSRQELESFQGIWSGGYFEADPLDPVAKSGYGALGYMSVLHATYLACIKPYITAETVALEIGPGRGAWTKTLLGAREVWALDALSARHNGFFEYVGTSENVRYVEVTDFECRMLPDDYFTYMFSFGCLCHVSFDGIRLYAQSLFNKMRSGSHCFWMVADYEKYNKAAESLDDLSIWRRLAPLGWPGLPLRLMMKLAESRVPGLITKDVHETDEPIPGRWYHAGAERTCELLRECGFRIVDRDVGTCLRDPIIHFMRP